MSAFPFEIVDVFTPTARAGVTANTASPAEWLALNCSEPGSAFATAGLP